jgi:hypothetical protein
MATNALYALEEAPLRAWIFLMTTMALQPSPPTDLTTKETPPLASPPTAESDAIVFHTDSNSNAPPKVQPRFFSIPEAKCSEANVYTLIKIFMAFS